MLQSTRRCPWRRDETRRDMDVETRCRSTTLLSWRYRYMSWSFSLLPFISDPLFPVKVPFSEVYFAQQQKASSKFDCPTLRETLCVPPIEVSLCRPCLPVALFLVQTWLYFFFFNESRIIFTKHSQMTYRPTRIHPIVPPSAPNTDSPSDATGTSSLRRFLGLFPQHQVPND
jgi:hypothetical protein